MQEKRIVIASDHAGFELKSYLTTVLKESGYAVLDLGPSDNAPLDYPDKAKVLAETLRQNPTDKGILICGTGIGMSIAVNRFPYIRGALVFTPEMATLSRQHNDANVLILGARTTTTEMAVACMRAFLQANFEGGRHEKRVAKLGGLSC